MFGQSAEVVECQPGVIPEAVYARRTPCILKGLASDWPIVQAADESPAKAVEYILSFYQKRPVRAFMAEPSVKGRFFYNDDINGFNFIQQNVYLDELLNKVVEVAGTPNVPTYYVGSTSIAEALPGFLEQQDASQRQHQHRVQPLGERKVLKSIWLGNRTRVAPHFDFPDNIACCVIGKRRFTFFPPEQLENLYIGPIDLTPAGQQISLVDLANPDLEKFPKFKQAMDAAIIADLEPGDAVFVPSMWWHQVEGLSDINGLVNFWWRTTPEFLGSPTAPLLHALLSLKSLPVEQREAWQRIFNYYVFEQPEGALDHLPDAAKGRLGDINEPIAKQLRAQLLNNLK